MKKNPNKTAGNWGALKNKPQNLVPFKSGGKVTVSAGGEKHVIYKKTTKRGEGKVGNVMVNHPTKDKGVWDTIDLTKKSGAKTIQQGVASTKKWHKENPYNDMKKKLTKKQMGGSSLIDKVKSNAKTIAKTPGPKGNVKFNLTGGNPFGPGANTPYIVDTTGLAAGKQSFPMRYGPGVPAAGKRVGNMTDTTVKEVLERNKKTNKKQMGGTKKYQNGGNTAADKVAQQRAINAKRKEEALARTEKSKVDARAKIDQAQKNKPVVKPAEPVAQTTSPVKNNPENEYRTVNARKDNTKAQIGVRTQAYNYENKGITKNKINLLGRGVTKTKTDKYLVPAKDVRFSDTDSPEITRRKLGYLSDKSDQQKTGTQKTRTVTNLKKGTVKNVTRSTGSYVKDGEKKRVVTKSTIPGKTNSGAMKKGGSVKKYQTGGSIDAKKYLEDSRKRVKAVTDSARKAEIKKGIYTYDDYLKKQIATKKKK